MVASLNRLLDTRGSVGIESGEQQRRFYLRTGDGQLVVNRLQPPSGHPQRRTSAVARFDLRAHLFQRLDDPRHRTAGERFVSTQLAGKFLPRKNPAQHANRRAGVSAIQRSGRRLQLRPTSLDYNRAFISLPFHAQSSQASESAGAVGAGRKILQLGRAFGDPAQHGVAMRNGFIAGQANGSGEGLGGANYDRLVLGHSSFNIKESVLLSDGRITSSRLG